MLNTFGIIGLFAAGKQIIKEKTKKELPASYWNNKDLMHKDKMNPNISPQQVMKNLENGKYYASEAILEKYERSVWFNYQIAEIKSKTVTLEYT